MTYRVKVSAWNAQGLWRTEDDFSGYETMAAANHASQRLRQQLASDGYTRQVSVGVWTITPAST